MTSQQQPAHSFHHLIRAQVPIDPKYWRWMEIVATTASGGEFFVGYMLMTGDDAGGADSVATDKGLFRFDDGKEYWFSPSVSSEMGDIASATSIDWNRVGEVDHNAENAKTLLGSWIDDAVGLEDLSSSTSVDAVITGPSGAVTWNENPPNAIPSGSRTFEVTLAGTTWTLAIKQTATNALNTVAWGRSTTSSPSTLNSSFGDNVELEKTTSHPTQPNYTYLYD